MLLLLLNEKTISCYVVLIVNRWSIVTCYPVTWFCSLSFSDFSSRKTLENGLDNERVVIPCSAILGAALLTHRMSKIKVSESFLLREQRRGIVYCRETVPEAVYIPLYSILSGLADWSNHFDYGLLSARFLSLLLLLNLIFDKHKSQSRIDSMLVSEWDGCLLFVRRKLFCLSDVIEVARIEVSKV